jgi:hypothetical protein
MAINLLAIISIVFVIFAGAIVALFVLHFKKKKSKAVESLKAQVATNAEDVSNLQTNVSSNTTNLKNMSTNITTDKITLGDWTIHGQTSAPYNTLQFCFKDNKGKLQRAASVKWDSINYGQIFSNEARMSKDFVGPNTTIQLLAKKDSVPYPSPCPS